MPRSYCEGSFRETNATNDVYSGGLKRYWIVALYVESGVVADVVFPLSSGRMPRIFRTHSGNWYLGMGRQIAKDIVSDGHD